MVIVLRQALINSLFVDYVHVIIYISLEDKSLSQI